MTLHPITLVDRVLDEYRNHVFTEFRARDEALRRALNQALDEPGFLAREPFFQAHRPFKDGLRWDALGLDAALADLMEDRSGSPNAYLHQSQSVIHLLAPAPGPLVVATGTGSGKTECFLLPVIQNALQDATAFSNRPGLTSILVYPMNALANDQEARIRDFLAIGGHGHIRVERYDRSTPQAKREEMRERPPHILLTNYMMLEYLLVRPADRDHLFANHRVRFLVLDEIHTYRGTLGANIALLFRRLLAHLRRARQDWNPGDPANPRRYPTPIPIATSATIKSMEDGDLSKQERTRLRDEAVQKFVGAITGFPAGDIRVVGEEIRDLHMPAEAAWPSSPPRLPVANPKDPASVAETLAALAGLPPNTPADASALHAAVLWKLNELLIRPRSVSGLVDAIRADVPEREATDPVALRAEVEAALIVGAALPDGTPGALRLRTHRFIRGGWRFHRCIDTACGRLHAMGADRCTCGAPTAPLYLCRSCGADALRFSGPALPQDEPLQPGGPRGDEGAEWMLYDLGRHTAEAGDEEAADAPEKKLVGTEKQMKSRPVLEGSFDPKTCSFNRDTSIYPMKVVLAPARNRCLVCGGTAGARDVLTPVSLGTSAAVRVLAEGLVEGLAEENRDKPDHDGKERLLIFADSRQDAAHQARFITYAGRYDRMRRRVLEVLAQGSKPLAEVIQGLVQFGVERHDNPHTLNFGDADYLSDVVKAKARAWEEAPLLDDLAVTASYRATVLNLGLVGVQYEHLGKHIAKADGALQRDLGLGERELAHLCRALLDEMRRRSALSRPMLRYHPVGPTCPDEFRSPADWERRIKAPQGFACDAKGRPMSWRESAEIPEGVGMSNAWRRAGRGGANPLLQKRFTHLMDRLGGAEATEERLLRLLDFLTEGPRLLVAAELHGIRKPVKLLQVNEDVVRLGRPGPQDLFRCVVCNVRMPWAYDGAPCPACHGALVPWPQEEILESRYAQRLLRDHGAGLVAGEHTAQITAEDRIDLEERFKGPPERSPINVLACSPTLEMGIDVGGLDAVVMRNVPPRPDNYAQRGGRSGRRSRVGAVLAYARSTPHEGYFYDKPEEMIAGEIPAPAVGLGNRDVILRHLFALAIGSAEPGLAGRMAEYVSLKGELRGETIDALVEAVRTEFEPAVRMARDAWGEDVLGPAELHNDEALRVALEGLPDRMRGLFDAVRQQVMELQTRVQIWSALGKGQSAALNAMSLTKRLLGLPDEGKREGDADDRTSGHPMRRFAEFGLLPGYEFPSEPSTLRLLGDDHEDETIAVERRFGIAQYQPDAPVHARGHRWRVAGLDRSSPWNPRTEDPTWIYHRCPACELRYEAQKHVVCPRCRSDATTVALPGYDFGGFLAVRSDMMILEEEDRFAMASLVGCHPQRDGRIAAKYRLSPGWVVTLAREEEIRWVNESLPPTPQDLKEGRACLHEKARGFPLCPACGFLLTVPAGEERKSGGRKKARKKDSADPFGHRADCARAGESPRPLAITAGSHATTLRIVVPIPADMTEGEYRRWGWSLGYSLRTGLRHLYMLDGPEVEVELEPFWDMRDGELPRRMGALTFIDPAVGGSGYLDRAAREFHRVAQRAAEHLDHKDCETACYRCLKSYRNQRRHEYLDWPLVLPHLEHLAAEAPEEISLDRTEKDDTRAWLEAYDAGVGSPLELRFLRLFEKHGLSVEKQAAVAPEQGDTPISVADFRVTGTKTLIYVDGAAFHRGQRLRRDGIIRGRLRDGGAGWRIVELRAADLKRGAALVGDIQAEG